MEDSSDSVNVGGSDGQIENRSVGSDAQLAGDSSSLALSAQNKYSVDGHDDEQWSVESTAAGTNLNSSLTSLIGNSASLAKNSTENTTDAILKYEAAVLQAKLLVQTVLNSALANERVLTAHRQQQSFSSTSAASASTCILSDSLEQNDMRKIISSICSGEHGQTFLSALSEIWRVPAVQSVLSSIWEKSPYDLLTDIWRDDVSYVEIRSALSQIWSDDHREKLWNILSEIWQLPNIQTILSSIWSSDQARSVLSSIWREKVCQVDIRSVLSQIWTNCDYDTALISLLETIWKSPAVQSVLTIIWQQSTVRTVLYELWKLSPEKIDPRSILSQVWTSDTDRYVVSVISAIWTEPAVRTELSRIWSTHSTDRDTLLANFSVLKHTQSTQVDHSSSASDEEFHGKQSDSCQLPNNRGNNDLYYTEFEYGKTEWRLKPREFVYDYRLPQFDCLKVDWVFGRSSGVSMLSAVSNRLKRHCVLYACDHVPVVYDYRLHRQFHLQAHTARVAVMACSSDGRWLLSVDRGADSCVLVHSVDSCKLLQYSFVEDPSVCILTACFTSDSQYIVLIRVQLSNGGGASGEPMEQIDSESAGGQQVLVWEWTLEHAVPRVVHQFNSGYKLFRTLSASALDPFMLAAQTNEILVFFRLNPCATDVSSTVKVYAPNLKSGYSREFKCNIGSFSSTSFSAIDPQLAYSGTTRGYLVLWSSQKLRNTGKSLEQCMNLKKTATKMVSVCDNGVVNISCIGDIVCAVTHPGRVMFYNSNLILISYLQKAYMGRILSISYDLDSEVGEIELVNSSMTADSQNSGAESDSCQPNINLCYPIESEFRVPDRGCIVCSEDGTCWRLDLKSRRCDPLLFHSAVSTLVVCVGSDTNHLLVGFVNGAVRLFNVASRCQEAVTTLSAQVCCLAASPCGQFVAAGLSDGKLQLMTALSLQTSQPPLLVSQNPLSQCVFSPDSKLIATGDAQQVVDVFRLTCDDGTWSLLSRTRAHHSTIRRLWFLSTVNDSSLRCRLFSLSEDRRIVEYDLEDDTRIRHGKTVKQYTQLNYPSVPLAVDYYPELPQSNYLILADSQFKLRLVTIDDWRCVKVTATPDYGFPAQHLCVLPAQVAGVDEDGSDDTCGHLAFSSGSRLVVAALPIDGDRRRSSSVVAHTAGVSCIQHSSDGQFIFTSGEEDSCLFMWKFDRNVLDTLARDRGAGIASFYRQLSSEFCQHLNDVWYYIQIQEQGENTTDERTLSETVPVNAVITILQAVGFFPSKQESDDILNELANRSPSACQDVNRLTFNDLVLIYCNHTPKDNDIKSRLKCAFKELAAHSADTHETVIDKQWLFNILQSQADSIGEQELEEILLQLMPEIGKQLSDHQRASLQSLIQYLPDKISWPELSHLLLGTKSSYRHSDQ